LGDAASIVFGRNPDTTDVLVEHPSISRRHAAILHDGKGGLCLYDFGSTHGTFVDGQRLVARDPIPLKNGSKVRFADSSRTYTLRLPKEAASSTFTTPAPKVPCSKSMAPPSQPSSSSSATATNKKKEEEEAVPFDDSIRAQLPTSFGGSVKNGGGLSFKEQMAAGVAEMMKQIAAEEEARSKRTSETTAEKDGGGDEEEYDDDEGMGPQPAKASGGGGSKSQNGGGGVVEEEKEDASSKYKLPISHEVTLRGHAKAITCIGINNAGNRVAVGATDYRVLLYDFGGMDKTHKPFRELTPEDGNGIVALSFP